VRNDKGKKDLPGGGRYQEEYLGNTLTHSLREVGGKGWDADKLECEDWVCRNASQKGRSEKRGGGRNLHSKVKTDRTGWTQGRGGGQIFPRGKREENCLDQRDESPKWGGQE